MSAAAALEVLCGSMDMTKLATTCVILFLALHICFFGGELLSVRPGTGWRQVFGARSPEELRKRARIEKEFHYIQQELMVKGAGVAFHGQCLVVLWCVFEFCLNPHASRAVQLVAGFAPYTLHGMISHRMINLTPRNLRIAKSLYFLGFNSFVLGQSLEQGTSDPVAQQTYQVGSRFIMTVIFMDTVFIAPAQAITSLSECYSYLKFKGDVNAIMSFVGGQGVLCVALITMSAAFQYTMWRYLEVSLQSADAGSMVSGFRQVLRGICDGEVLLDKDLRIQGEAPCLQHILMSRNSLEGKAFTEFLDEGERGRFSEFLSSSSEAAGADSSSNEAAMAVRPCHRVSLRGACNIRVGIDLFHVPVADSMREETLHLIALREDGESRNPPEADVDVCDDWLDHLRKHQEEAQSPQNATRRAASRVSGSSAGYLLPACPEMAELTMLVDMGTPLMDVVQAHLRYKRVNHEPAADMPCMRSLILPTDWETVRGKAERFLRKIREGKTTEPKAMNGLRLKTPHDPRRYMIARTAQLLPCLAEEEPSGSGPRLWLHMSNFVEESSRVRPPADLTGIREGRRPG